MRNNERILPEFIPLVNYFPREKTALNLFSFIITNTYKSNIIF